MPFINKIYFSIILFPNNKTQMTKKIAIGMLAVSAFALMGCQQKPAATPPSTQQQTSTATIKINEGQTTTSTGTLDIQPSTEETKANQ